jgi:putative membrane protein (TIGR04086 family)
MHGSRSKYPVASHNKGHVSRRGTLSAARPREVEEQGTLKATAKASLIGLGVFAATGLLLITGASALALMLDDPTAAVTPLALAALMLSSFAGGFTATKIVRESPLLCGFMTGAMCAALMLIASLCLAGVRSSHYSLFQGILMHGFALLFCILGAYTGNYKRKPKKRRYGR